MNKQNLTFIVAFIMLLLYLSIPALNGENLAKASLFSFSTKKEVKLGDFPVIVPTYRNGFIVENFIVEDGRIAPNMTLGQLLSDKGIEYPIIANLVESCKGVFNVNSGFRVNKPYTVFKNKETLHPEYFVFEPNVFEYYVFDLKDGKTVEKIEKPIEVKKTTVEGVIESTLWETMVTQGISFEVAAKMEDALQWSVDFSHTQKGDRFIMFYDQQFIEGEEVGAGQVHAAYYNREGKESYAIWYDDGEYKGFYDLEGRAIASNFLKAPVKYTRISSRYNKKRFHPILKRVRPHLGTDYAAPYGTPIYAVGNGVITEAAYTKGNGRYIKIKHDDVYQTQYLHMQKFAKGMKKGVQVAQGEVIGYVGSTGLATGPHVCFRFWKNGKQVNHLRENLPAPKPLPEDVLKEFLKVKNVMVAKIHEKRAAKVDVLETPKTEDQNTAP